MSFSVSRLMSSFSFAPRRALAATAALLCCATCATSTSTPPPPPSTSTPPATTVTPAPRTPPSGTLHLIFTSDEHGWLLPHKDKAAAKLRGGVLGAAAAMKAEGFAPGAPNWLLLSAGDMWTGPYESTVLEGAPMTAAMNKMGYRAAAVGNHEFDFGTRVIGERMKAAHFPFLASNIIDVAREQHPPWAKPYTILDVPFGDAGGTLKVGVFGLGCFSSPTTADVRHMVGLRFDPYRQAVARWLPELKKESPDLIVVVAHDAIAEIEPVVDLLRANGVAAVANGHEHRAGIVVDANDNADEADDVVFCNGGPYLRSFCRVDLELKDGKVVTHDERIVPVERALPAPNEAGVVVDPAAAGADPALTAILADAEESAARIGGEVLVDNKQKLTRGRDGSLGQLVVDAWLDSLPFAQVALTNAGGLRQDIEAGPLRLRDVVSALPFNNYLLVVDMTGAELKEQLAKDETIAGGVRFEFHEEHGGIRVVDRVVDAAGKPIADDAKLKVIINDFMYRGGDKYRFVDREPEETAVDWREPIFRYLRDLKTKGGVLDRGVDARASK